MNTASISSAKSARKRPGYERSTSLWAVCDHSWALLTPAEQTVYRRLVIFRGGFTRQAAEQVAGATLARLAALAGKSLLHRTPAGRYELHELLRQYAAAKLDEAGETESVAERHRDYWQSLLANPDDTVWPAPWPVSTTWSLACSTKPAFAIMPKPAASLMLTRPRLWPSF